VKKALNILAVLLVFAYLIVGLGFTSSSMKEMVCQRIEIKMVDSIESGFYTSKEIIRRYLNNGHGYLGYPLSEINTRELEAKLLKSPYFERADVYTQVNGSLCVRIVQRKPYVRIITRSQETWYLNEDGYILPGRGGVSPHILVANGYFTEGNELRNTLLIDSIQNPSKYKEWFDVLELAKFIKNDKFWNAQIVQLYYNRNGDFELIPRVGAHQIILGDAEGYEEKFEKLLVFYKEGLNYEGWNQYERINLKYKNQIICTKR